MATASRPPSLHLASHGHSPRVHRRQAAQLLAAGPWCTVAHAPWKRRGLKSRCTRKARAGQPRTGAALRQAADVHMLCMWRKCKWPTERLVRVPRSSSGASEELSQCRTFVLRVHGVTTTLHDSTGLHHAPPGSTLLHPVPPLSVRSLSFLLSMFVHTSACSCAHASVHSSPVVHTPTTPSPSVCLSYASGAVGSCIGNRMHMQHKVHQLVHQQAPA